MTISHADSHDLDKLKRWYEGLSSGGSGRFPVHAVLLVSPEDTASHDIFRAFRSSFETRAAPFQHLVIFGQHGVSSTVRRMLPELGLQRESLPVLVLFGEASATTFHSLPLPGGTTGAGEGATCPWMEVLGQVEGAVDDGEVTLDLASLPGHTNHQLHKGRMAELVGRVLESLT